MYYYIHVESFNSILLSYHAKLTDRVKLSSHNHAKSECKTIKYNKIYCLKLYKLRKKLMPNTALVRSKIMLNRKKFLF